MDRNDIRIKKIPTPLAWQLAAELEKRIPFKDIYFAKRADQTVEKWKVMDIINEDVIDPNFKDIVLKFKPSSALKALAMDALEIDDVLLKITEVGCNVKVNENGYAPYALSVGTSDYWNGAWPAVITFHISHWAHNNLARSYASKDVELTRDLHRYFGSPACGDDDSTLACMVGAVRWRGFAVDTNRIKNLKEKFQKELGEKPKSLATAPHIARRYICQHLDETERLIVADSTKRVILEEIATWEDDSGATHLAARAAQDVLDARKAVKKIELFDKLLRAGRFHASLVVIGTRSSRMAGADDLNAQGIDHTDEVRECFPLAPPGMILSGGDMESFEVVLADAAYDDPVLHADLLSGKKIHALLGEFFYPDESYDEILNSKGSEIDHYSSSKQGVFAIIYGGEGYTLSTRVGLDESDAENAYQKIIKRYKGIGKARRVIFDMFCSMRQPGGLGTKVEWHEPADYVESMLGFRRYFTLENRICKALFDLASDPPKDWVNLKINVIRRDRIQSASGAVRSALYGAAFQIQAANMRAAANHVIQSTGAQITKNVQRKIWDIQPHGVTPWQVMPINIHDEIMVPTAPEKVDLVAQVVDQAVESYREKVPLIAIDWHKKLESWAGK
jgi:hypothetical protein